MKLLSGAVAAAALFMAAGAGVAHANTYTISDSDQSDGSLVSGYTYSTPKFVTDKGTGPFQDEFAFTIDTSYDAGISAAFIQDTSSKIKSSIASAMLSLYSGVYSGTLNSANLIAQTATFDPSAGVPTLTASSIASGAYFIVANVTPNAGYNADYSVNVTLGDVSSAPEPGAWALMIAGVGLAGVAFRRGRRYRTAGQLA